MSLWIYQLGRVVRWKDRQDRYCRQLLTKPFWSGTQRGLDIERDRAHSLKG